MTTKKFAINQEPHKAEIGEHTILFQPEAVGAAFVQAYSGLREVQKQVTAAGDEVDADLLTAVNTEMRAFLARFMLPESAELFETLKLPDRVLVQLLEWVAELYGGGSGNAAGGSSSAS
jgi:hypothetical protein